MLGSTHPFMSQRPIKEIETRLQEQWERNEIYRAGTRNTEPFYGLVEFPFPSGDGLHVGHLRSYVGIDVYTRRQRMLGKDVLFPMGWDAFGLPTENAAIKNKMKPQDITARNVANFKRQFHMLGMGFDWSREINTTDPEYYRWTQWQFLQFVKHGLAYKAITEINWCPRCKIGLANEEAQGGVCERCGNPVEKREKSQWMIRITQYADRLLSDLDGLDYLEKIKTQQRNWIGKSEGANVSFSLRGLNQDVASSVTVFTTRPDTIFGVTFLLISPELAKRWMEAGWVASQEVKSYVSSTLLRPETDRGAEGKEKTGVDTGIKAVNPANGVEVPVWVADYVLGGYGTGAVMAVPAHDERDFAFAKKFELPIKRVVSSQQDAEFSAETDDVSEADGFAIDSDFLTGLPTWKAKEDMMSWLEEKGCGTRTVTYKLRDWVFSRQRYWGEPIPLVHCGVCAKQKQKVLLVHGYGSGADKLWFPWMKTELEHAGFEVLAPTLSDAKHPDFGTWMKELAPFIAQLGPQDVVVAHSMGGKAAIHALQRANKKIGHLILVASSVFLPTEERHWEQLAVAWPGLDLPLVKAFWGAELLPSNLDTFATDKQFISSSDDPFVPQEAIDRVPEGWFRQTSQGKGHFQGNAYPELLERIIATKHNGWMMLPESTLPLTLPPIDAYEPSDDGESPLATMTDWVKAVCPNCGGPARRETDTMPNWAGSSWYFIRYLDPKNTEQSASAEALKKWMPVDLYNGGMEHTTLHLLYSRFWYKFLFDIGAVPRECGSEPYKSRRSQGMILAADGSKMSKSKGNVVNPDDVVATYGADVTRAYMMFIGPFDQPAPWDTNGMEGVRKFLDRVWSLYKNGVSVEETADIRTLYHQTIKKIGDGIDQMQFNTCISQLMILVNAYQALGGVPKEHRAGFLQILAPFAPFIAEELWSHKENVDTIHLSAWPKYDEAALEAESYTLVVQVNGKLRGKLSLGKEVADERQIRALAEQDDGVKTWIEGKVIAKTVYVKGRLINFITE